MNLLEANREMSVLEQRYFELHRQAKAAEADLANTRESVTVPSARLRALLDEAEREKRAILLKIETLEERLLDEAD
jgi:hypothetical protein